MKSKRYKATIEFEAYETPPGLPPLKERIRQCIEGHPTLSFVIEKVRVEDLASGGFDELIIHRSKHDIGLPPEVSNFKYVPESAVITVTGDHKCMIDGRARASEGFVLVVNGVEREGVAEVHTNDVIELRLRMGSLERLKDFEVVAGNVSGDEEISRVIGRINESNADVVEVSPTMFGPGTFYRVDRRTDPPTVSLEGLEDEDQGNAR